jgi:hypothetical protein
LLVKRIINFVIADVNKEEYFSGPVETVPLYLIDYKLSEKIVHPQPGEQNRGGDESYLLFLAAMFYVYILYSESADRYYIGHTNDSERRLIEHKTSELGKPGELNQAIKYVIS